MKARNFDRLAPPRTIAVNLIESCVTFGTGDDFEWWHHQYWSVSQASMGRLLDLLFTTTQFRFMYTTYDEIIFLEYKPPR